MFSKGNYWICETCDSTYYIKDDMNTLDTCDFCSGYYVYFIEEDKKTEVPPFTE